MRIVAVRNGEYNKETGHLSSSGKVQIKKQAEWLTQQELGKILVLHSPRACAVESAKIISGIIKDATLRESVLLRFSAADRALAPFPELAKEMDTLFREFETIIIVSHRVIAEYFPAFYAKERWDAVTDTPILLMGQSWMVSSPVPLFA